MKACVHCSLHVSLRASDNLAGDRIRHVSDMIRQRIRLDGNAVIPLVGLPPLQTFQLHLRFTQWEVLLRDRLIVRERRKLRRKELPVAVDDLPCLGFEILVIGICFAHLHRYAKRCGQGFRISCFGFS